MSPPGRIHTQRLALASTYHLQRGRGGNKTLSTQLYLTRLTRQEKRKDSKDMQGYLASGFIALQEALLSVRPYIQFLLIAALVH